MQNITSGMTVYEAEDVRNDITPNGAYGNDVKYCSQTNE